MRIEPTELRLGNLFIEQNSKEVIEVTDLEKNRVVFSGQFLDKWQAAPIPLTEEWLIKFGFTLAYSAIHENTFIYKKNDFTIEFLGDLIFVEGIQIDLKHVHQLQNLYFALTNKELTYES